MRKEPLTAEQIDKIMDKTERRVVQKKEQEAALARERQQETPSQAIIAY
jgi:hypothetical protein